MNPDNIIKTEAGLTTATVTITKERYEELLRREHGFKYRQAELKAATFVTTGERFIFEIEEEDDF